MKNIPVAYIIAFISAGALFLGFGIFLAYRMTRNLTGLPLGPRSGDEEGEGLEAALARGKPRDSKCLALHNGALRRTDGRYVVAYDGNPQQTMLAADEIAVDRSRRLAGMLTADMPEQTIIQFRYAVYPDRGQALANHVQNSPPLDAVHAPAVALHARQLAHHARLAAEGRFKDVKLSVWACVPTHHSNDNLHNGTAGFFRHFKRSLKLGGARGVLEAFREARALTGDGILRRTIEDEEQAYRDADRTFRMIEREGAVLRLRRMEGPKLRQALYMGHNESATSCPNIADDPLADLRPYLCNDTIKGDGHYVLHGNTPVSIVTVFVPPEPDTHAAIMRLLVGHPNLTFRHTVVAEFETVGREKAKARLRQRMKRIVKANVSARTGQVKLNEEQERAYSDLRKVRSELTSPSKMLTRLRLSVLVYGSPVRTKRDELEAARELEVRCEQIIEALREMPGVDAAREEPVALRALYHNLLPGEMTTDVTEREIEEVATSLATLIPAERPWKGAEHHAHTFVQSVCGTTLGINLFQPDKFPPLGYALGHMGSGKTVMLGLLANGVLARVPHATVMGCDFNDGLSALVEYNGGRNLRFVFDEDRTINVWSYPGLKDGLPPDEEQVALVVAELMLLARRDESDVIAETVLETCVRAVYENEVPYNGPDEELHEPTHTHLLNKLRTYHFENAQMRETASLLHPILERYRGNKFLDAPTHPDFAHASRFDVFNIDSLDKFPPDIQKALAFRIGARLVSSVGRKVDGQIHPLLLLFVEMHRIKDKYPSIFTALRKGARMGRTNNVVTLLDTHSYDDLAPIHDITANAGIKIIGKQSEGAAELAARIGLSEAAAGAIASIRNMAGSHSQYVIALGSGPDAQVEKIQVELSPEELWVLTTHGDERNARARFPRLKPNWGMGEIVAFLAAHYPRGLAFMGLKGFDEYLLPSDEEELMVSEANGYVDSLRARLAELEREVTAYRNLHGPLTVPPLVERRSGDRGQDSRAIN